MITNKTVLSVAAVLTLTFSGMTVDSVHAQRLAHGGGDKGSVVSVTVDQKGQHRRGRTELNKGKSQKGKKVANGQRGRGINSSEVEGTPTPDANGGSNDPAVTQTPEARHGHGTRGRDVQHSQRRGRNGNDNATKVPGATETPEATGTPEAEHGDRATPVASETPEVEIGRHGGDNATPVPSDPGATPTVVGQGDDHDGNSGNATPVATSVPEGTGTPESHSGRGGR